MLNPDERLNLMKMVNTSECEDNTEAIRKLKHSNHILNNVRIVENLKRQHAELRINSNDEFIELCREKASFLFANYTDIFNKLLKDEINLVILIKMLKILQMIEEEKVDQHEGSVLVGKYLKELYIDSALRRADHMNEADTNKEPEFREAKNISWKFFKMNKEI